MVLMEMFINFSSLPESLGMLILGSGLIGATVALRKMFSRRDVSKTESNLEKTIA